MKLILILALTKLKMMRQLFTTLLLFVALSASFAIETDKLNYIGMPVGGICTGQVYLGGDGQLWHWDIFNVAMLNPGGGGGCRFYVNPQAQQKRFENGFGLTIKQGDREFFRALNQTGFADIQFTGEYPIGKVSYKDRGLPVVVNLQAFSPFVPADADHSGMPLTVLEYTIKNTSDEELEVDMTGWLQNMSCFLTGKGKDGEHANKIEKGDGYIRLNCKSENTNENSFADWGSMSLSLLEDGVGSAKAYMQDGLPMYFGDPKIKEAKSALGDKLVGTVSGSVKLKKGESKTFTYLLSWYFPNVHLWNGGHRWKNKENLRHYYTVNFKDAADVSNYAIKNKWLLSETRNWNKVWYDSSLPKWFLDRTFLNVSTLATNVCVRFNDLTDDPDNEGRFYTMEGLYLGHGTCTHVFHYEQAMGRVFPNLARQLREQIDLGLSWKDNGIIQYRSAEYSGTGQQDGRDYAIDGHAGTIMRIYREHLMASDDSFLKNNWRKIKQSIQYMIDHDKEKTGKADGVLEGIQYNTLDRMWYGKISWISGLYAASLKAGAEMAKEAGDKQFAKTCSGIAALAYQNISNELFNGEYFYQELDPDHLDAPNTNNGCHIDQLLGQYWSTQLGLGDIVPNEQVKKALKSILKYNYVENYGDYLSNADIPIKRWYADDDEQGVIMCSFPKGGADKAPGKINNEWEKLVVGYFSEVWTGQEHQFAASLISEGLIEEGLKVVKAVHNRYSPERRNPYNEIEYGNHYTRAMSSYGAFVSACGFKYHGPKGEISFAPKINSGNFKSAFITAEGWGSYAQKINNNEMVCAIELVHGKLKLKTIGLNASAGIQPVAVEVDGVPTDNYKYDKKSGHVSIGFEHTLLEGDKISVTFKY